MEVAEKVMRASRNPEDYFNSSKVFTKSIINPGSQTPDYFLSSSMIINLLKNNLIAQMIKTIDHQE